MPEGKLSEVKRQLLEGLCMIINPPFAEFVNGKSNQECRLSRALETGGGRLIDDNFSCEVARMREA
jgi:hypothetical protein